MKKFSILLSLILVVMFAGTSGANLITNGSFEADDGSSYNGFLTLGDGSTAITGWTVVGSIDWIGNYWQASDGERSLDLAGSGSSGSVVGYSFETIVGQSYIVSFDMAGNPDRDYDKALIGAEIIGDVVAEAFIFDQDTQTRDSMGWVTQSFMFVADSSESQLYFGNVGLTTTSWGAALDNVIVEAAPVPEPATMLLLGTGLVGLAATSRKKIFKKK